MGSYKRSYTTSPLFLHYTYVFIYIIYWQGHAHLIRQWQNTVTTYKEPDQLQNQCISLPTRIYCSYLYTTCVVWKPSIHLWHASLVCHVCLLVGVWMPILWATVIVHANFSSFTCIKRAGIHAYPHMCIKFKLSCTVALYKLNPKHIAKNMDKLF